MGLSEEHEKWDEHGDHTAPQGTADVSRSGGDPSMMAAVYRDSFVKRVCLGVDWVSVLTLKYLDSLVGA